MKAELTVLEGVLARGDRRVGAVIEEAYRKGAIYDSWSEFFKNEVWMEAFKTCSVDIDFYTTRERSLDELFPWDFIDAGVSKDFLRESGRMRLMKSDSNCRQKCSAAVLPNMVAVSALRNDKTVKLRVQINRLM